MLCLPAYAKNVAFLRSLWKRTLRFVWSTWSAWPSSTAAWNPVLKISLGQTAGLMGFWKPMNFRNPVRIWGPFSSSRTFVPYMNRIQKNRAWMCNWYMCHISYHHWACKEMELGITGGEEDGVNNEDANPEDLYSKPEDALTKTSRRVKGSLGQLWHQVMGSRSICCFRPFFFGSGFHAFGGPK